MRITKNQLRGLIQEEMRRKRLDEISRIGARRRRDKIKLILKQKYVEAGGVEPGASEYAKIHLKKIKRLTPNDITYFEKYIDSLVGAEEAEFEAEHGDLPDSEEEVAALNLSKHTVRADRPGEILTHGGTGEEDIFSVSVKDSVKKTQSIDYTRIMGDILSGDKLLKQGMGGNAYKNSDDPKKRQTWAQIKLIQQLLIDADYAKGLFTKADGVYGELTKKAVVKMQKDLKLSIDGVVGRQTATAFDPRKKAQKVPITGKEIEDSVQEMVLDLPAGTMETFRKTDAKDVNEGFRRWGVLAGVEKSSGPS